MSPAQNGAPKTAKRKKEQTTTAPKELQSASDYNKTARGNVISKTREGTKIEKTSDLESFTQVISYIIETRFFDIGIGLVVIANAICIGVELSLSLDGSDTTVVKGFDIFFLVVYTVELLMRFCVYGFVQAFRRPWVTFDFALVVMGLVGLLILEPIANSSDGSGSNALGSVMVLRMLRLLRLGRTLRLFKLFSQLSEFLAVLRGLVSSMGLIAGTFFTLVLVLYVFACFGTRTHHQKPS